jgi:hypothetical protein
VLIKIAAHFLFVLAASAGTAAAWNYSRISPRHNSDNLVAMEAALERLTNTNRRFAARLHNAEGIDRGNAFDDYPTNGSSFAAGRSMQLIAFKKAGSGRYP